MARVLNIEIPNNKRVVISLTYIYGIGRTLAAKICADAKISEDKRVKDLTDDELTRIREEAKKYTTEGDLRREVNLNHIVVLDIVKAYLYVVNVLKKMQEQEKVLERQSLVRREQLNNG